MDEKNPGGNYPEKSLFDSVVCVVGLGYVGLLVARAFAEKVKVIGLDTDRQKALDVQKNNQNGNLVITSNPEKIKEAAYSDPKRPLIPI